MDQAFVATLEGSVKAVHELNAEQEALKARLKEKTAELDLALGALKGQISESRKVVKLAMDPAAWKQFGIS